MIRLYSDPMVALEISRGFHRGTIPVTVVTSEAEVRGSAKTVSVVFYGDLAKEAASSLVQGSKFTFRGFIDIDKGGNPQIVGLTLTKI